MRWGRLGKGGSRKTEPSKHAFDLSSVQWGRVQLLTGCAVIGVGLMATVASSAHIGPAPTLTVASADQTVAMAAPQILPIPARPELEFRPPAVSPALPGMLDPLAVPRMRAAALPDGPLGIPGIVLQAYELAEQRIGAESPQCELPWFLLAGIGRIESGHAGNGNVDSSGTTLTPIAGPVLNGTLAGNEVIVDSDGGRLDGDAGHDRAMGPMQFIPSTWASWGSDANGDGKSDPNNIFDATYSAGRYLCAGVTDIMAEETKVSAVMRYNHSAEYAANVLAWATGYATGVTPTDTGPLPAPTSGPSTPPSTSSSSSPTSSAPPSESPSSSKPSTTTPIPCPIICLPPIVLPPLPPPPPPPPAR